MSDKTYILTEAQIEQIRAEAFDEFVELYEKFCNSNIECSSNDCIGKFCPKCFRDNFMEQFKEQK